ncbi:BREX-1 system adenine-specific DNA-methyltransferase PglX [Desulfosporosinus sp. BICA1-9]|uniref:BREX-1 system adenine-specific DNA-methyltransferase PglX n=1 Tax=Desulfosporosinus sp. BICA1-9 TaxID=1531958 RepID=UPI00054BA5FA|nr:BREX-1 system adenine-specific DNA-methyltransferase PglX [Desulfosporosinus sp. BICA1-9]KJS50639.1 MAG: restriction endonuclease [Peptococcaceae bacterium BRH_c23]KJS88833.1 MAG: restriction endonuclease [Desulfosporosinus sp. BICA1-9]HBW37731.1 BREX-1 system adenine-specific DNA-methyltransferase PglX [Desulfosporosinus sp.]
MNKAALKSFAVSARQELIHKVSLRAQLFGIDANTNTKVERQGEKLMVNKLAYPLSMEGTFESLQGAYKDKGYQQLLEEAAYIWFNRIIAIRYMEIHEYLPERVNVLSSSTGKVEPDIVLNYASMELEVDKTTIRKLLEAGNHEDAYRKLFIAQCNALQPILPFMFERIDDYTELLLPDFLLDSESVINELVKDEELTASFQEVEVIGWLYQYYISEKKDEVSAKLKKNIKIIKEDIPAATQLFTPNWIVRYMVENSLGTLWLEAHPESSIKPEMRYYVESAEQSEEVKKQLEELKNPKLSPENIRLLDPACGSGHILVYAFDLLYSIYEERGYVVSDIPTLILEKNLFGIDIDDRAAQLASFALFMKARAKSRRIFRNPPQINIISIQESNGLLDEGVVPLIAENEDEVMQLELLLRTFIDAKNYGSILKPIQIDFNKYLTKVERLKAQLNENLFVNNERNLLSRLEQLLSQAMTLADRYEIVITNPPYMGNKGMNSKLSEHLRENYKNSKADLFAVFMERMESFVKPFGFHVSVTMQSWMFLSSYEDYRKHLLQEFSILNMTHMGNNVMGIAFGTCATILRSIKKQVGVFNYVELEDLVEGIPSVFPVKKNRYAIVSSERFLDIPGSPIAYWSSDQVRKIFKEFLTLDELAEARKGMETGDNDQFLRFWFEVNMQKIGFDSEDYKEALISKRKWFPYNKGGTFRKWYGNQEYVVNWENDGQWIKNFNRSIIRNKSYFFRQGITWSDVSSSYFGVRFLPKGFLFDNSGSMAFPSNDEYELLLGFMCCHISVEMLKILNPTMHSQVGNIKNLPVIIPHSKIEIRSKVNENISISRLDWNSSEISWDFIRHPWLCHEEEIPKLSDTYSRWINEADNRFTQLKSNEESLNRIFIEQYGLQDEMTPEVPDEEVTVRKADRLRDSKSFLSYFIGCVMGRYSLDLEGLAYAGGDFDASNYHKFTPNRNGLILLTDDAYFENDIISHLKTFLSVTFSEDTVEENLAWIAESLTQRNNESTEERIRRYFLDEFFKDHCQIYQKRPIYWLVDSGSAKGLRTLIYLHRYQPDTLATIRFEQLQEIQAKYSNEIDTLEMRLVNPSLSAVEKRAFEKKKELFRRRIEELIDFDKVLAVYANAQIALDLDDGVKVNYAKLQKVLAKI